VIRAWHPYREGFWRENCYGLCTCAGLLRVTSHTATPFRRMGTQKLTLMASVNGLRLFTCRSGDQRAGASHGRRSNSP
ncbi:mCG146196, partial [Mus musculus]